jgi:hypothetical protein
MHTTTTRASHNAPASPRSRSRKGNDTEGGAHPRKHPHRMVPTQIREYEHAVKLVGPCRLTGPVEWSSWTTIRGPGHAH